MKDVIVIGAGLGGLMAAAKLAASGKKVLVLEKKALPGGTSYVFRRGGYAFPMGPLSFSFPGRVHDFLAEAGVAEGISFRRSGFELRTPFLDVMMSLRLADLESELAIVFPQEAAGLREFFGELGAAIAVSRDMDRWHPDISALRPRPAAKRCEAAAEPGRVTQVLRLSGLPSAPVLERLIGNEHLRNFLGSMGTEPPEMSMLNLATMWNVMSEEGIWFPSCGIHGIADILRRRIIELGGEVRLAEPVRKIIVQNGRAAGVMTDKGQILEGRSVVSNADYKMTFLDLLEASDIPGVDLDHVRDIPYTGSELCVYLGIRPEETDLKSILAEHLFFRKEFRSSSVSDLEDFANRDFEICYWSRKAPELAPAGRASLVLRVSFPFGHFERWRLGEKVRQDGYKDYKTALAWKLVRTAEGILPGLSRAVEVMEIATPLTYRDWGNRYDGSIAGWSWAARESGRLPGKILVRTPVPALFAAGVYAASELFLGGVPTALFTGSLAADYILAD